MTCSAFRHGPFELTGPGQCCAGLRGRRPKTVASQTKSWCADVRHAGGQACAGRAPIPKVEAFRIPAAPAAIRPVLEMLPVQLVSLALAALAGHEPGNFKLLTKVTTIE